MVRVRKSCCGVLQQVRVDHSRVETSAIRSAEELRAGCGDEGEDAAEGRHSQELVDPDAFRAQRRRGGDVIQDSCELNVKHQEWWGGLVCEVQAAFDRWVRVGKTVGVKGCGGKKGEVG